MNKRIPIILGLIILILAEWLLVTNSPFVQAWVTRLNDLSYDSQLKIKLLSHPAPPQSPIVIVDIDDKSLKLEGQWPWPRSKIAKLINNLQDNGAVVIALDILLSEAQTNIATALLNNLDQKRMITPPMETVLKQVAPDFDEDAQLAKVLSKTDMVLSMTFLKLPQTEGLLPAPILTLTPLQEKQLSLHSANGYICSIPILQMAAKNSGFLNVFADPDGIIRRVPLLFRYKDGVYPSLALEAVRLYLLTDIHIITANYEKAEKIESISLGDHLIQTDERGQALIPFVGGSFSFPYFSAEDVLKNQVAKNAFAGKIIFVGTSATGLGDLRATSLEGAFPGVEIQASMANGILQNNFSYRPAWAYGAEFIFTTIFGIIIVLLFPYLGPRSLSIFIIVAPIILIFANNWLWEKTGLIISILIPIILLITLAMINMIYGYLFESRRRERLKIMFGQYVPPKHIDAMLRSTDSYGLYGEDRTMTVLFADIRNFTNISEPLSATQLKELLNDYFTPMTEIIFKNRGTIDKYVGDLLMAFWGAPLNDKKHALHALESALEMQDMLQKLQPEFVKRGYPEIRIGVGINSGDMSVGDMGSRYRRNYTVLGDAVNLASRVENLTKYYDVKIIATEFTQKGHNSIIFRQLDRVRVKGKEKAVTIYEVVCKAVDLKEDIHYEVETSNRALEHYYKQEWQQSRELFEELHNDHPNQKFYRLYLDRIQEYEKNPPPADWDGIHAHGLKNYY